MEAMANTDIQTDEELKQKSQTIRGTLEAEITQLDDADLEQEAERILREGYGALMQEDKEYARDLDGIFLKLREADEREVEQEAAWEAEEQAQEES